MGNKSVNEAAGLNISTIYNTFFKKLSIIQQKDFLASSFLGVGTCIPTIKNPNPNTPAQGNSSTRHQ